MSSVPQVDQSSVRPWLGYPPSRPLCCLCGCAYIHLEVPAWLHQAKEETLASNSSVSCCPAFCWLERRCPHSCFWASSLASTSPTSSATISSQATPATSNMAIDPRQGRTLETGKADHHNLAMHFQYLACYALIHLGCSAFLPWLVTLLSFLSCLASVSSSSTWTFGFYASQGRWCSVLPGPCWSAFWWITSTLWKSLKPLLPRQVAKRRNNIRCVGPATCDIVSHFDALEAGEVIFHILSYSATVIDVSNLAFMIRLSLCRSMLCLQTLTSLNCAVALNRARPQAWMRLLPPLCNSVCCPLQTLLICCFWRHFCREQNPCSGKVAKFMLYP